MLQLWHSPHDDALGRAREAINVEFWGRTATEIPTWTGGDGHPGVYLNNTYKTMRVVAEDYAWVYTKWCTDDEELYDSRNDPYELDNIAGSPDPYIQRVRSRMNALLMVMKSCEVETCHDPWKVLQPASHGDSCASPGGARAINCFADALDPKYDDFFATIPAVNIAECLNYQYAPNETPFYPPEAQFGLGLAHRNEPSFFEYPDLALVARVPEVLGGGWEQRHVAFEALLADERQLTADELAQQWNETSCSEGQECTVDPRTLVLGNDTAR